MDPNDQSSFNLGIALSGGGARGIAHLGVLKAFHEAGLQPQIVSGTSAGAIAGALLAAAKSPGEMEEFVQSANFVRALFPSWPNKGLISLSYLKKHLKKHLPADRFEDLSLPLHIAIANLNTGKAEVRTKGPLFEAIMASAAIPLVFQPVIMDDQTYVDGGLFMNLPAAPIRNKCRVLVGVNLVPEMEVPQKKISSVRSILERSFDLAILNNTKPQLELCDLVIEPKELIKFHIFQFNKTDELMKLGYESGKEAIPALRKLLEESEKQSN